MHNLLDFNKQIFSQNSGGMKKGHPQKQATPHPRTKQEQNLENREPNLQPQLPLLKETSPSNLPRSKQHPPKWDQKQDPKLCNPKPQNKNKNRTRKKDS